VLAASYYSLQGNLKAILNLNNKGLLPLEVTPTLFSLSGERLDVPAVTVDATSFRVIDLAQWVAEGDRLSDKEAFSFSTAVKTSS
jgi:hypothetical protein